MCSEIVIKLSKIEKILSDTVCISYGGQLDCYQKRLGIQGVKIFIYSDNSVNDGQCEVRDSV